VAYRVLLSQAEVARHLGVHVKTVRDIVRKRKIRTYPHPTNGKAKGVDEKGLKEIEAALEPAAVG
jgi:transposase